MKYKVGDKIKVEAERRQVYSQPGYVSRERVSVKTLTIKTIISDGLYVVAISGLYHKGRFGSRIPKQGRLHLEDTMGWLTTSPPRPAKWEVTII